MENRITLLPHHISRTFIMQHREWIFVYSQDYHAKGCFGQAWSAHGEPNAFPVPVLLKVCLSQTDRWFSDNFYDEQKKLIDEKIAAIPRDGRPIFPFRSIGKGHSEMHTRAPKLYKYLMDELGKIVALYEYDYRGLKYPIYGN